MAGLFSPFPLKTYYQRNVDLMSKNKGNDIKAKIIYKAEVTKIMVHDKIKEKTNRFKIWEKIPKNRWMNWRLLE